MKNRLEKRLRVTNLTFCTWALMAGAFLSSCMNRPDYYIVEIEVPQIENEECGQWLADRLRRVGQVPEEYAISEFLMEPPRIRLNYNYINTSSRNIEHHIASLGFEVHAKPIGPNHGSPQDETYDEPYIIPANEAARAKLPIACR